MPLLATLLPILLQYGLPLIESAIADIRKLNDSPATTSADWAALFAKWETLKNKTGDDYRNDAIANLPPT